MKSASAGLAAHLAGEAVTLATMWRVVRRDGAVFTFTDHDQNKVYAGETYLASVGYQRAAISSGAELAVDETELLGMLNDGTIEPEHLRAGLWDHAEVRIFAVNWANLTQGEVKLRRGRLGEVVAQDDGTFRAELRGLAQPLQQTIGGFYQPECRADLGDAKCKIDLTYGAGWTQQDAIAAVTDSVTLVMTSALASFDDAYFTFGTLTWQTGDNAGVSREIIAWDQSALTLSLFSPPPYAPAPGDVLHVSPGCAKIERVCKAPFNNFLNFRGEPDVPGAMAILDRPA